MRAVDYFSGNNRGIAKVVALLFIVSILASYFVALDDFPGIDSLHASAYVNPPGGGGSGGGGIPTIPSVEVVALLSASEAAELLKKFEPGDVAKVLAKVGDIKHVSKIISYFSSDYALSILEELDPVLTSRILHLLGGDKAATLVLDLTGNGYMVVDELVYNDYNGTVLLLDICVKNVLSLEEDAREPRMVKLSEAVGILDKTTLVRLLISISGLPDTPSTAAYIIGSMSLPRVIDIVDEWVGNDEFNPSSNVLISVFGFLDSQLIGEIYSGVTDQTRLALLEIMPDELKDGLPVVGKYSAINLRVSSTQVEQGESLEFEYVLKNQGGLTDDYLIPVKINGVTIFLDEGILASNESITLVHVLDTSIMGSFIIEVLGQSIEYEVTSPIQVIAPTPFEVTVQKIEVIPNRVARGENITIFTIVKNIGETADISDVELVIDSKRVDSKEVYLVGGDSITIIFNVPAEYIEGAHKISIIDAESEFNVFNPPPTIPWLTFITAGVIIVVSSYFYITQKKLGYNISPN